MATDTKETPATAVPPRPTEYPIHPYCNLLPRPNAEDRGALKANIKKIGVQEPIILAKIGRHHAMLDGQTRQSIVLELYDEGIYKADNGDPLACNAHFLPDTTTPDEMLSLVESKNLRRNLNGAQKACRALEFHGERVRMAKAVGKPIKIEGDFADYLSQTYGVNRRYFVFVNVLHKEDKKLFDAVYSGAMTLAQGHKAHQIAKGRVKGGKVAPTPTGYKDANDLPVPKSLDAVFADVEHFEVLSAEVRKIAKRVKVLSESASGAFLEFGSLSASLTNVATSISKARPYVVCPHCKGKAGGCDKCKKTGFLTSLMLSVGAQRAEEKVKKGATAPAKAATTPAAPAGTPAAVPTAAPASAKARGKPDPEAGVDKSKAKAKEAAKETETATAK